MRRITILLAVLLCCAPAWAKKKEITVKTAEEFIAALGPDRTIVIDSRAPLMLTPVVDEWITKHDLPVYDYFRNRPNEKGLGWYDLFDGVGLAIIDYDNLTIKAKGDNATLMTTPRYADVLTFDQCDNLVLENITLGHTNTGTCECGVLGLKGCNGVTVSECDLFGCGTEAISIEGCENVNVSNTCMHDCSYYTLHVIGSSDVTFSDCVFRDNGEYGNINIDNSDNVSFVSCLFEHLRGELFCVYSDTRFYDCVFNDCNYTENPYVIICEDDAKAEEVEFCDGLVFKSSSGILEFLSAAWPMCGEDSEFLQDCVEVIQGRLTADKFVYDAQNGYISVTNGKNEDARHAEACYWKRKDGKALLAIYSWQNCFDPQLRFFLIDKQAGTIERIPRPFNISQPVSEYNMQYELPRYGKTIRAVTYDIVDSNGEPVRYEFTFNGTTFDLR